MNKGSNITNIKLINLIIMMLTRFFTIFGRNKGLRCLLASLLLN